MGTREKWSPIVIGMEHNSGDGVLVVKTYYLYAM